MVRRHELTDQARPPRWPVGRPPPRGQRDLCKLATGVPWRDLPEALGRSRGGLTTKLHLACDGRGRPLAMLVTAGQRHESTRLEPLLDAIRVPRPGSGRPRKRPTRLIADRGDSYTTCRRLLRQRRIAHTIPERSDQQARTRRGARAAGRPWLVLCATGNATSLNEPSPASSSVDLHG